MPAATAVRQVGKRLNRWKIRAGGARTYARMRRRETRIRRPDFTSVIGHSDVSVEGGVGRSVDLAHAALADEGGHVVVPEAGADVQGHKL